MVAALASRPAVGSGAPRVQLFGVGIDALRISQAVSLILDWAERLPGHCRYVVTPNVDHTVMLQHHEGLKRAYHEADLVLADGWPVVLASRLLGQPLPQRVPGSDLVPALFAAAGSGRNLRVFLLGAAPGVADRAAARIERQWPGVAVVGTYSPPIGFEQDAAETQHILRLIEDAQPDLLIVGLGAPKQELWVHRHHDRIHARVALCVGATIDFLAGEKKRAPGWMRRVGLEWLHRLCSEPRRLMRRYLRDAWIFPQLVWGQWRTGRNRRPAGQITSMRSFLS